MVRNLLSPRSGNPVANQFVIRTENGTYFQSYRSIVAKVDNDGTITLSWYWDYSRTTMKYLYQFLADYGFPDMYAQEVRKALKDGTFKYDARLSM